MSSLIVTKNPKHWPIHIPGVQVLSSKDYLTDPHYAELENVKLFNLCKSYHYQSNGYYVSLLAAARGHKPVPDISTLQNMRSVAISRIMTEDLELMIQTNLRDIQSKDFVLSIYFGKNLAKRYDRLAWKLYNMFEAPMLRAFFVFKKEWILKRITPISMDDVPDHHRPFLVDRALAYFSKKKMRSSKKISFSYDLALLYDPKEKFPPSDSKALKHFAKAAEAEGMRPELITKDDFGRIAEFDALFIRTTTQVYDYTYQFARRAEAEGLAVIDDPESIIRCTNKVFLAECLKKHKIPIPQTFILQREQMKSLENKIIFPCVLKLPDSAFSLGVIKVDDWDSFVTQASSFFDESDLIITQEFIPTAFDWRIGILDGKPLYACRYHMAAEHWQIMKQSNTGETFAGKVEAVPLRQVPAQVLETALKSTYPIGKGLYGVDLKEIDGKAYVIEVNDNPSIDAGYEDSLLGDKLYGWIMKSLRGRIEWLKKGKQIR
ncbi:MAG: RimK family protein [Candidatus Omnitrophota bacterium]|nr:RimK family protein [Candidatus Omnitrophota bacterium]